MTILSNSKAVHFLVCIKIGILFLRSVGTIERGGQGWSEIFMTLFLYTLIQGLII